MMLSKIISGHQTGADIAAIDAAMANGFLCGGWVPKGRKTWRLGLPYIIGNTNLQSPDARYGRGLNHCLKALPGDGKRDKDFPSKEEISKK